jgi:hypothetical protein
MQRAQEIVERALKMAEAEELRRESGVPGEGSVEFWKHCVRELHRMLGEISAGAPSGVSSGLAHATVDALSPTNPTADLLVSAEQAYLREAKRQGKR